MRRSCLLLCLAASCTPSTPAARLADFPEPRLAGTETGLVLGYDTSVDCFSLSTDVQGTVDGRPITVTSRGGWRNTTEGNVCDPIWLSFPGPLAPNAVTSIHFADGETTWDLGVEGLSPRHWSFALVAPGGDTVREGSDLTVRYAPATPGVTLGSVFIDRAGITPEVSHTADSKTVHIETGYWSLSDSSLHGTTRPGTLAAELGPLVVHGCEGLAGCELSTHVPDPELPITIAIP